MNTGLSDFAVPMMHQQHFHNERDNPRNESSSQTARRYRDQDMYSRVVLVPATNARKIHTVRDEINCTRPQEPSAQHNNGYLVHDSMDMRSVGHRQPTEHPNDKPPTFGNGGYNPAVAGQKQDIIVQGMGGMSLQNPHEPARHSGPPQRLPHSNSSPVPLSQAMIRSNQRVTEWQTRPPNNDDNGESFVIDEYTDTLRSDVSNAESENYRMTNRVPMRSSSLVNSANMRYDQRPPLQYQRSTLDDMSTPSIRSGSNEEYDTGDDDDAGLVKSLSCIQKPPEVTSRQNSNGSQSSLESGYSFTTVYPSGEGYNQYKMTQQKQHDRSKRPAQIATPAPTEPHHQSTRVQATVSTEPYFGRSQSQHGAYGYNRLPSEQSGIRQQINQRADEASRQDHAQKPPSVFITYAEEDNNKEFKKVVLQLTRTLYSNGIQVRLDMLESTIMSMSVSSWIDDNIQKCDFVVVCVSPSYKSEVESQITTATPDSHSLHTRYIYNRLLTQYIQNGSLNYRFIPVLMGGATRKDLPSLCLDTHVYEWPKEFEAIIYRLFKKEKYIQPKVGPPPKCTVETYDSFDDRLLNG